MTDAEMNKLKAEIARREAELADFRSHGWSSYNDYLAGKIAAMRAELGTEKRASGYSAFV